MFTGIIKGIGRIEGLSPLSLRVPLDLTVGLDVGASVAVDGVCLTVVAIEDNQLCFDLSAETRQLTTLGGYTLGMLVNLERAARVGDEIGGHLFSGHVCGQVVLIDKGDLWTFTCSPFCAPYLFYKGFVALNGVSLTVARRDPGTFAVAFIPETLRQTTFGHKHIGDHINLEWDLNTYAVVETVRQLFFNDL